ncbi:hypothetical protein JOD24_000427 [Kroppenstedtia sanguinis]|uniref:hypothetical protein n=1 Tax=Kroppenstedtia sanguinis TaxID=1380684 RepID=UPI003D2062C7
MGVDKLELDDHGKFQVWLMEMGDILERFIDHIPPETRLDYTPESLLRLEEWMLEHYPSVDDLLKESNKETLDALVRYTGQVYRKNLKGKWTIHLDDPNYAFFGLPMISFHIPRIDPVAPHSEVVASVDRRRGDYIYTVFKATERLIEEAKT